MWKVKEIFIVSRSIPILLYLNQFHLNSILNQFQLHLCQIRRYAMYCLSNLCVHIVAIQVPKQSVRNHHNLWKLRGAHSDQGICWNIAPLNFQRNDAKPTPFFCLPPLIMFGKKSAPLNYWKHFYCPPEFCPAFWKPPLKLNGNLKPLLVPPWICFIAYLLN